MSSFTLERGAVISPPTDMQIVSNLEPVPQFKDNNNVTILRDLNYTHDQKLVQDYVGITFHQGSGLSQHDLPLNKQDQYLPQDALLLQQNSVVPQQYALMPPQDALMPPQDAHIPQNDATLAKQDVLLSQNDAVQRIQTKYAAPENLQSLIPNTQINIITVEPDSVKTNSSSSAFSDTSSDVSDITTSIPSANSDSSYVLPVVEGISENDIGQVDMFYRSHKTEVTVCRSLANLYVSTAKVKVKEPEVQLSRRKSKSFKEKKSKSSETPTLTRPVPADFSREDWSFTKTGIPTLVLDTGDHIREKQIKIVLAEKGTGFTLWQDQINHLTEYNTPHSNFHTITVSTDSTRLVGLSFDVGKAAVDFADAAKSLIADEVADVQNATLKKKKKDKPKHKYKPPKKVDISQPVCFVHVTKIQRPDLVASLFPPPPKGAGMSRLGIPRALSDSSGISECSTTLSEHEITDLNVPFGNI